MLVNGTSNIYSAQTPASISRPTQSAIDKVSASRATTGSIATGGLDFTNMTPRQLQGTMNDLIKSGKMSLNDTSAIVEMVPTALSKVNYDGQVPVAYEQPTNFIARIQDGIEGAKSRSDTINEERLTKALGALQKLQGTAIGVDLHA